MNDNIIVLTRSQIMTLYDIAKHFGDVQNFQLKCSTNGIGPIVTLTINLFEQEDATIETDMTDVSTW